MRLICLVDDKAQAGSRFQKEHGLSFWIETQHGRVLFDTGASGRMLLHNMKVAGIKPDSIDALALSHAHYDHTGSLEAVLQRTGRVPLYANPDLFRERFSRRGGELKSIGLTIPRERLQRLAELHLSAEPQQILPGVYTSGEITARPEPEGRSLRHSVRDGDGWVADPYQDDMSIVLRVKQDLVLVCGCCHAGLLNTLLKVRSSLDGEVVAIVGGMHLKALDSEQLQHIVQVLRLYGPPQLYPNHCTGKRAYAALTQAFGECVAPCPAGTEVIF